MLDSSKRNFVDKEEPQDREEEDGMNFFEDVKYMNNFHKILTYDQNYGFSQSPVLVIDDNTFNTIGI